MVAGPSQQMAAGFAQPTSSDAASLAVARRHRSALLSHIQSFERSLAAPSGDPGWCARVSARLHDVCEAFTEHIVVTEGPDGLYAEILDHAPRLARGVSVLIREHAAIVAAMSALQTRVGAPVPPVDELRGWGSDLLRELSRHRQRGADLVFEAYQTDIGGET